MGEGEWGRWTRECGERVTCMSGVWGVRTACASLGRWGLGYFINQGANVSKHCQVVLAFGLQ